MTDDEETPNRVAHVHHYVLKGSGLSHYAECDVLWVQHPGVQVLDDAPNEDGTVAVEGWIRGSRVRCREKLAGDNGPIVGSRAKVESAMP